MTTIRKTTRHAAAPNRMRNRGKCGCSARVRTWVSKFASIHFRRTHIYSLFISPYKFGLFSTVLFSPKSLRPAHQTDSLKILLDLSNDRYNGVLFSASTDRRRRATMYMSSATFFWSTCSRQNYGHINRRHCRYFLRHRVYHAIARLHRQNLAY